MRSFRPSERCTYAVLELELWFVLLDDVIVERPVPIGQLRPSIDDLRRQIDQLSLRLLASLDHLQKSAERKKDN